MAFKYQSLIDSFNFSVGCPDGATEIDILAYRWAHTPIGNNLNFLPNVKYDEALNVPTRALEPTDICSRCGASFYVTENKARTNFSRYRTGLEKKHVDLTKRYTHLAIGQIRKKDGRATKIEKEHFGFYEYEGCDFKQSFTILEQPL